MMIEDLRKIITLEFGNKLTMFEYNQYIPKLRDYFITYIIENKSYCTSVERLFKDELTRNDLIMSTVSYVTSNQNVTSKSAIDDFLVALNRLFDEIIQERFPNATLLRLKPFTSLAKEVEDELIRMGYVLNERESFPPISEDQFEFIKTALANYEIHKSRSHQVKIIIKLILLYGFSFDRLSELRISDYDSSTRTLKINYKENLNRYLFLELPFSLVADIEEYLELRSNSEEINSELLFVSDTGTKLTNSLASDFLGTLKKSYEVYIGKRIEGRNPFTPTGLQKYAMINMILEGMNQSIIMELTGNREQIFKDCQNRVDELKEMNRNRYINHMIRGIKTYDLL